jgi:putative ABC transport system permease protein
MALFVVVVALASAALVGGLEGQTKAGDRWDATFEEANGAHVTIDGSADVLAEVAALPEVESSTHPYRRPVLELDVRRDGESLETVIVREMAADDLPPIGRPLLRDGRWVRAGATGEIVIDRAFGLEEGIGVGDEVAIGSPGGPLSYTVVGRAIDLVDCFYPNCAPVTTWVDPAAYRLLEVESIDTVFVRLHDPDAVEPFLVELGEYPVGTQDWIDTRADATAAYEILGAFLGAFGVFVMIAAAVVVAGSMATRAVARRRDIGLLKAVGTTPRQVTTAIVAAHALAAAVGVAAGWVIGGLLAPVTQVDLGETLGTGGASFSPRSLLVALVVVELIVVVATVFPAWRAGRVPTTSALASVAPHRAGGRVLGWITGRLALGPVATAGLRDAFGRPARSALTAVALALALVATLATLATDRSIDRVFGDPRLVGNPEELRVYPTGAGEDSIRSAVDGHADVESWFTETPQDLALGDETFLGLAMGGDLASAGFVVGEGRAATAPGEAMAGWGLLDRFGLDVGDRVTVTVGGEPLPLEIVGWYRESEDTGQILRFLLSDLRRVRPDAPADWASVNLVGGADTAAVAAALAAELGGGARVVPQTLEGSDEIDAFRIAFLLASLLVIIVALANLASTMLLSVRQRTHDLGVLRAVGVTPRQVVRLVAVGAGALAVVAAAVGLPLAWLVGNAITEVVGASSGIGPGIGTGPGLVNTLVVVPASVAVAALLGALAARRAARAEVSDLVRLE